MCWARAEVRWQEAPRRDQLVVLPAPEADTAVEWMRAAGCTTWDEVARVAPRLVGQLRELAKDRE